MQESWGYLASSRHLPNGHVAHLEVMSVFPSPPIPIPCIYSSQLKSWGNSNDGGSLLSNGASRENGSSNSSSWEEEGISWALEAMV